MSRLECLLVNSYARSLIQRFVEIPILQRLGLTIENKRVLELGCGSGRAARLLRNAGAKQVVATDVSLRSYLYNLSFDRRDNIDSVEMDASNFSLFPEDDIIDRCVSFGLLHHVVKWRQVIAEVARFLPSGGIYALTDFTASGLQRWLWRVVCAHPSEALFTTADIVNELHRHGFRIAGLTHRFFGDIVFCVAIKS